MPDGMIVLAPNWLGDAVMALPSIADLKRTFPSTALVVAARPSVAGMFGLAPYVDEVVTLEWRGRVLRQRGLSADVARLREIRADVAVLLPNSFAAAWLARRAEIPERWGYSSDMRSPLLTRSVRKPKGRLHQGRYYQHLVRELGAPSGPPEPVLEVSTDDGVAAERFLVTRGWNGRAPLVAIAPGAAYGTAKRWLPRHFVKLIENVTDAGFRLQAEVTCVLVGSAADKETTDLICNALPATARARVIDLAGATSLRMLAGVLHLADGCVSNDSGAMHLAAAVGVPVVALFGPTREDETAPLGRYDRAARVLVNPVWCRPCMLRECPIDHRCMKGLSPERVYQSVSELMESQG